MKKVVVMSLALGLAAASAWATPIVISASSCSLDYQAGLAGSTAGFWQGNAYIMLNNSSSAHNATGTAWLGINQAIPNGSYDVTVRYETGTVEAAGAGQDAVQMGVTGTATYQENGNVNGVLGPKTYYPASTYGVTSSTWYDAQFAGPQGSAGWFCPVWSGSDLPTSITVSGVNGTDSRLWLSIQDGLAGNYDYAIINSITLTPVPEPMTMSLLVLGGLPLIRRKQNQM
jgi:hypothetical protein